MLTNSRKCLKWSQKDAASLPQSEVEIPLPKIFKFIFFKLKMASSDALLWYFMRFTCRATKV